MGSGDQRERGKLFNEVAALYEQVRPSYPDELFADLVAVTAVDTHSSVLEVGCGSGQATRSLAELGALWQRSNPESRWLTWPVNDWLASRTSPSTA